MEIKIRTDNHYHTATVKGEAAERLLSLMLPYTKVGKAKNSKDKVFKIIEDSVFCLTEQVKIMLFEGYYLVVKS